MYILAISWYRSVTTCQLGHVLVKLVHNLFMLSSMRLLHPTEVQIGFDPDSYTVSEEDGSATLTVRLASELLERDVEVRFMTENDVALGEDYVCTCN